MKDKKPNIYNYKDFVLFLKDTLDFYREKEDLSLRDLSRKLKVQVSLLSMVLNKKRIASEGIIKKIYAFIELNEYEIKLANQLKNIYKSKEIEIQKASIENLNRKKGFREANRNEYEFSKYLSKWYYVAIKELTALEVFEEDPEWIQSKLAYAVTKSEIIKALKFLKKTEILKYENKRLVASEKQMNCEDGIFRITLGSYHKQILSLVSKSIEVIPRNQRQILGYTLSLSDKNRNRADQILNDAFEKIKLLDLELNETDQFLDKTTNIYQIELASIPLTISGVKNEKK